MTRHPVALVGVYLTLAAGFVVMAENKIVAVGCLLGGIAYGLATRPKK